MKVLLVPSAASNPINVGHDEDALSLADAYPHANDTSSHRTCRCTYHWNSTSKLKKKSITILISICNECYKILGNLRPIKGYAQYTKMKNQQTWKDCVVDLNGTNPLLSEWNNTEKKRNQSSPTAMAFHAEDRRRRSSRVSWCRQIAWLPDGLNDCSVTWRRGSGAVWRFRATLRCYGTPEVLLGSGRFYRFDPSEDG